MTRTEPGSAGAGSRLERVQVSRAVPCVRSQHHPDPGEYSDLPALGWSSSKGKTSAIKTSPDSARAVNPLLSSLEEPKPQRCPCTSHSQSRIPSKNPLPAGSLPIHVPREGPWNVPVLIPSRGDSRRPAGADPRSKPGSKLKAEPSLARVTPGAAQNVSQPLSFVGIFWQKICGCTLEMKGSPSQGTRQRHFKEK